MELQLSQARNEIKNIREQLHKLQSQYARDLSEIREQLRRLVSGEEARTPPPVCVVKKTRSVNSTRRALVIASCDTTGVEEQGVSSSPADVSIESLPSFYSMKPIGWIESMFHNKNGTPRQPGVCPEGRAKLSISRSLFTNPAHSLVGLEKFSHIWIIFVFHKNNNAYNGAKVCPPRLDGAKVGIFSSRCPYRPNPVGLTLAKIDRIEDNVIHLRGVDILNGTPVIDIKPFIPQYDSVVVTSPNVPFIPQYDSVLTSPQYDSVVTSPNVSGVTTPVKPQVDDKRDDETNLELSSEERRSTSLLTVVKTLGSGSDDGRAKEETTESRTSCPTNAPVTLVHKSCESTSNESNENVKAIVDEVLGGFKNDVSIGESIDNLKLLSTSHEGLADQLRNQSVDLLIDQSRIDRPSEDCVLVADWITKPSSGVGLTVSFTPRAEQQLTQYGRRENLECFGLRHLNDAEEVRRAIGAILRADPRSVYRRKNCADRLYYFSVDTLRVTCWFDEQIAEVLDIRPDIKKLDAANY